MSNENETPYVETMTADQLADAVREAHRDNDHYDVDHYCCRLTNRIADLERQLAEARKDTRDPTYDELEEFARAVWKTCGASDPLNEEYFNKWGSRLFNKQQPPRRFA